jgi:hypothetical protein
MSEPIAYINVEERKLEWATPIKWETPTVVVMGRVPLYTKKEWVGLTTDEVFELSSTRLPHGLFAGLIEAKLREKNT